MKLLTNALIVIGVLLLLATIVGRFVGDPGFLLGRRVVSLLLASNTTLLLAVLSKLSEKK